MEAHATPPIAQAATTRAAKKPIKCVVWDLDNTLWDGVLLEDNHVTLREQVTNVIETLDSRGILQSIASKNDHALAMQQLEAFGLDQYFLHPQINWNSKVEAIQNIAKLINIGIDTIAFLDDQPFEREEVQFSLPQVLCIDSADLSGLLDMPVMNPPFITADSRMRRQMYQSDIVRQNVEQEFVGTKEAFLATLQMVFMIAPAQTEDLQRAEELTVRTNQLNTTGYTYSYDELNAFRESDQHKLLIASLDDRYGNYGKIGLVLLECQPDSWTIKLLLMSCRVMSRGVGTILINYIMREAQRANVRLLAEFISNDRNRMMYISYRFANFNEIANDGERILFENDLTRIQPDPDYVTVQILEN
jgi:FkbH-like protein